MSPFTKPTLRSHLLIVINNLSSEQLADLGKKIKALPVSPIVTLVKSIPIHDSHQLEEVQARQSLAKAKQDLNFHASTEILFGSNPKNIKNLFADGIFDVVVDADRNNQLHAMAKNEEAAGMKSLVSEMPTTILSASQPTISAASYKPLFTPINKSRPALVEEKAVTAEKVNATPAPEPAPALKK